MKLACEASLSEASLSALTLYCIVLTLDACIFQLLDACIFPFQRSIPSPNVLVSTVSLREEVSSTACKLQPEQLPLK